MKRFLLLLIALTALFSLVACGGNNADSESQQSVWNFGSESDTPSFDITSEATAIMEQYKISGGDFYSSDAESNDARLNDDLVLSYFGDGISVPDFSSVLEYAVYIDESKPLDPCEFGIFRIKSSDAAEEFMKYLKARVDTKIETSKAYPTMDTTALTTAEFGIQNGYVWYTVVKGGNAEINESLKEKA